MRNHVSEGPEFAHLKGRETVRTAITQPMNKARYASVAIWPLLLTLCLLMSSCGRKAPPVPPGTIRPKAVSDLGYEVTPQGVTLTWSVPVRNTDGSPLAWIDGFELFKAEIPLEKDCAECPPPFGRPIDISFRAKPEEARHVVYDDRTLGSGRRYVYQVRTRKGWFFNVSDLSNRISLAWHVPPAAPLDLTAVSAEDGVKLSWLPPTTWVDGSPLDEATVYRLYRADLTDGQWKPLPDLIEATEYVDRTAKPRRGYRYSVAAVFHYAGTDVAGPRTQEVAARGQDVAAPGPPGGLVAVRSVRGTELLWKESSEPDVSGYHVYREGGDGQIDRLTAAPVRRPRLVDQTPLPPGRYRYWVTAVDLADPANESAPSAAAQVDVEASRHSTP